MSWLKGHEETCPSKYAYIFVMDRMRVNWHEYQETPRKIVRDFLDVMEAEGVASKKD